TSNLVREGTPFPTRNPPSAGGSTLPPSTPTATTSPSCSPSCPPPPPTRTPTTPPTPTDVCFPNHNGTDGHGYVRAHISNYSALLNNEPNEIATDQAYIKSALNDCSNHQASSARVYGSYPSGGDQSTALAIANKVISPVLQNLGATQFI